MNTKKPTKLQFVECSGPSYEFFDRQTNSQDIEAALAGPKKGKIKKYF